MKKQGAFLPPSEGRTIRQTLSKPATTLRFLESHNIFALISFMGYLIHPGLSQLQGWLRRVRGISTLPFETGTDLTAEGMTTM